MVDDELGRELGVDPRRVAAEVAHRVPHRREVDDRGNACEVLVQDAARREGDRLGRLRSGDPARNCFDVRGRHGRTVLVAEDVLEEDPERVRQAQHVEALLERVESEDLDVTLADREPRTRCEAIRMGHRSRFKQLRVRQPLHPALGERLLARREVPHDRVGVRPADPASVGGKAFVAHRLEILGVRIEQVLAADLAGGVEERDAHPERDLEDAALLPLGLAQERVVDRRELGRARQAPRIRAEVGERLL